MRKKSPLLVQLVVAKRPLATRRLVHAADHRRGERRNAAPAVTAGGQSRPGPVPRDRPAERPSRRFRAARVPPVSGPATHCRAAGPSHVAAAGRCPRSWRRRAARLQRLAAENIETAPPPGWSPMRTRTDKPRSATPAGLPSVPGEIRQPVAERGGRADHGRERRSYTSAPDHARWHRRRWHAARRASSR